MPGAPACSKRAGRDDFVTSPRSCGLVPSRRYRDHCGEPHAWPMRQHSPHCDIDVVAAMLCDATTARDTSPRSCGLIPSRRYGDRCGKPHAWPMTQTKYKQLQLSQPHTSGRGDVSAHAPQLALWMTAGRPPLGALEAVSACKQHGRQQSQVCKTGKVAKFQ